MHFGFLGLKVNKTSCLLWKVFLKVEVYRLPESETPGECVKMQSLRLHLKKKIMSLRISPRNPYM